MAALPAGFPQPPKPPPGSVLMTDKAWVDWAMQLYQWQLKLLAALS